MRGSLEFQRRFQDRKIGRVSITAPFKGSDFWRGDWDAENACSGHLSTPDLSALLILCLLEVVQVNTLKFHGSVRPNVNTICIIRIQRSLVDAHGLRRKLHPADNRSLRPQTGSQSWLRNVSVHGHVDEQDHNDGTQNDPPIGNLNARYRCFLAKPFHDVCPEIGR
jgi:hypothetical protein